MFYPHSREQPRSGEQSIGAAERPVPDPRGRLDDVMARVYGTSSGVRHDTEPVRDSVRDEDDEWSSAEPGSPADPPHGHSPRSPSGLPGRLVRRWAPVGAVGSGGGTDSSGLGTRGLGTRGLGRRGMSMIAAVTAVVVALLAGAYVMSTGPSTQRPVSRPALPVARVSPTVSVSAPVTSSSTTVVVSVVGHVADPGVLTLPAGARVADAIEAAGGVREPSDRRSVNLARRVVDGEQLYIGVPAPATANTAAASAAGAESGTVNINTAGAEALKSLPGVGEVMAGRIMDWRSEHGGFQRIAQLRRIDGIGPSTFADLRDRVRVG